VGNPEKVKIEADIPEDAIREALESVERHEVDVESLKAQLELSQIKGREMMEKLKDTHERMLRASADLENFKKRAQKEKEEVQKFGAERMLRDFLPVFDNLERALEHGKTASDFDSLKTGVAMTRKQFEDAFGKHGVKGFTSVGQPFDPRLHEAMQQVERSDVPANQVVFEMVRGFTLNDRLIRPALVTVSKAPAEQAAEVAPKLEEPAPVLQQSAEPARDQG
jgi:molecular chaperone GrpE